MGDFLIVFGERGDVARGRASLVNRPGMGGHAVREFAFGWGRAVLQEPKGQGFAPLESGGRTLVCVGRPVVRGGGCGPGPAAFGEWVREISAGASLAEGAERATASLSGMYAIFELSEDAIVVLTDHMGFRPVYVARSRDRALLGIGTHVESLASAAGMTLDVDPVSVGELFAHNYVTFPYTTRRGIRELEPCSLTTVRVRRLELDTRVLWEPTEPTRFPGAGVMSERLKSALLEAGSDLVRGCDRVGVLLSGGIDSRAVLAALPGGTGVSALTYVTRENRETRVAAEVAAAAGAARISVRRGEDYFPTLVGRGLGLLGMELRANCHGLCLADNGLTDSFGVVIGGQLSDTLLKDHFMPLEKRQALRPLGLRGRLRRIVKGREPVKRAGAGHTTGREAIESELTPEIRAAVRARKERRLEEVRRVRPTTADEWQRFWPCSRQDDSAHTLGNARITCSDTLFAHQAVVEISRDFAPALRVDGRLTNAVFCDICGALAEIENANTGLPASASLRDQRKGRRVREVDRRETDGGDWNAVETSWVNPVVMQQRSPFWVEGRARLASSGAASFLSGVIARGGETMLSSYQDDLPSTSNHIAFQLALWLDRLGVEERAPATGAVS